MHIRPFEPADEDAVVALWERCGLTRPWNDPRKDIRRKLAVRPDLFLVGVLGGEVVATASGAERTHVRHALLGLDVEVVDGQDPARFGAETMKDVAGYDVKRLFIGGRGAFGALTNLIFKITVEG